MTPAAPMLATQMSDSDQPTYANYKFVKKKRKEKGVDSSVKVERCQLIIAQQSLRINISS